ncbi:MAG TPA: ATP-binding protein [Sulfuricella sp.]|nr:ATP-binding protein [Sulfuricella sp.]
MMSIRKYLLIWLLLGLAVAGLAAGIVTYHKTLEEVNEMLDYELRQIAYSMEHSSRFMAARLENVDDSSRDDNDFVVQVWNPDGTLRYSSQPSIGLPLTQGQGFSDLQWADGRWRVFTLASGNRVIQAAQPQDARRETAVEMALRMLAPLAALVPALAILAWIVVRKSLSPLSRVTAEVGRRDAATMDSLDTHGVPAEIRPLILSLNDLLRRLDESMAVQRRFVADAAHELRTPLTALSLQAQLVEQARDPKEREEAIDDLRQGIARASHLVSQLLTLARQEPDAPRPFVRLDLAAMAKQVVGEFAPLADAKGVDLGIDADESHFIAGEEGALRVLIGNLVDNAIRYTPKGGKVDVAVHEVEHGVELKVGDNGPGIPHEEREHVFERFYRLAGQDIPGSGLGLAIVQQVTKRHGATVVLESMDGNHGAVFRVVFPDPSI